MTTLTTHYRDAEDALRRAQAGSRVSQQALARAQLHALLAVADELRAIRNELITIHGVVVGLADTRASRNS
jgi:hypothetical protein